MLMSEMVASVLTFIGNMRKKKGEKTSRLSGTKPEPMCRRNTMEKGFGTIELDSLFGGYEIINRPANSLPQALASAVGNVNSGILGATYQPIWYVGKQTVNGENHFLICEEIRSTKDRNKMIVGLVINLPPGDGVIKGEGAKVVDIIEEARLAPELEAAFFNATKQLIGVSYKPLAYIGKQVVRGENHYFISEAKAIYPGANPFAVVICLNIFDGNVSVVSIAPLKADGGALGYAFTW